MDLFQLLSSWEGKGEGENLPAEIRTSAMPRNRFLIATLRFVAATMSSLGRYGRMVSTSFAFPFLTATHKGDLM